MSDTDLEELHGLAARLDVPRRAFQGDHYDLDEGHRQRAIELGAQPVTSRELLVRLRAAGLRLPPAARRAAARSTAGGGDDGGTQLGDGDR